MTRYLTADQIVRIHDAEDFSPLSRPDGLASAVGRPQQSVGGEDAYPTIHDKAAALWQSIDHNQPFENGNKRTAVLSTSAFYALNGYVVTWTDDEIYRLAMQVAGKMIDVTQLAERLKGLVQPIPSALDETATQVDVRDPTPSEVSDGLG